MTEQLIKSKKRVQQHGEVFTPRWMVELMLDIPEVKQACETIHATFLEPAAGDGNFLLAILERKLQAVVSQFDQKDWAVQSLWALASLYGIEFLADNLELARNRLFVYYLDWYEQAFSGRLDSKSDQYKSAWYLICKNIIRGNTLTKRHPDTDQPLVFYEWEQVGQKKVRAKQFIFADLVGEEMTLDKTLVEGQLSLFEFDDEELIEPEEVPVLALQKVYQLGG